MRMQLTLQINGVSHRIEADPDRTLLSVLRDDLGLTGTKYGCGDGKCGACTLLVDRQPVQACSITVGAAAGSRITTVEGLAQDGRLHPIQAAFLVEGAFQCGYCTPGMIMAATALLRANPHPDEGEIREALKGNLCRCTGYHNIVRAVRRAAEGGAPA